MLQVKSAGLFDIMDDGARANMNTQMLEGAAQDALRALARVGSDPALSAIAAQLHEYLNGPDGQTEEAGQYPVNDRIGPSGPNEDQPFDQMGVV